MTRLITRHVSDRRALRSTGSNGRRPAARQRPASSSSSNSRRQQLGPARLGSARLGGIQTGLAAPPGRSETNTHSALLGVTVAPSRALDRRAAPAGRASLPPTHDNAAEKQVSDSAAAARRLSE